MEKGYTLQKEKHRFICGCFASVTSSGSCYSPPSPQGEGFRLVCLRFFALVLHCERLLLLASPLRSAKRSYFEPPSEREVANNVSRKEPAQLTHRTRHKPSAFLLCTRAPPYTALRCFPSSRRRAFGCPFTGLFRRESGFYFLTFHSRQRSVLTLSLPLEESEAILL